MKIEVSRGRLLQIVTHSLRDGNKLLELFSSRAAEWNFIVCALLVIVSRDLQICIHVSLARIHRRRIFGFCRHSKAEKHFLAALNAR